MHMWLQPPEIKTIGSPQRGDTLASLAFLVFCSSIDISVIWRRYRYDIYRSREIHFQLFYRSFHR